MITQNDELYNTFKNPSSLFNNLPFNIMPRNPCYEEKFNSDKCSVKYIIRNNTKIGRTEKMEIVAVGGKNTTLVIDPKYIFSMKTKNGGKFDVIKFEKGTTLKFKMYKKTKNPSINIGTKFSEISLNLNTDNLNETCSDHMYEKLDYDIIVFSYKGNCFFDKLNGYVEYLEMDSKLERDIYNTFLFRTKKD